MATLSTSAPRTERMLPTSMPRRCSAPWGERSASSTAPAEETAYTTPITASCETRRVRLPRLELVADQECGGGAERGDLGERDVDEDHLARDDVEAQVGMDAGEDQAHEERKPHQVQQLGAHLVVTRSLRASRIT